MGPRDSTASLAVVGAVSVSYPRDQLIEWVEKVCVREGAYYITGIGGSVPAQEKAARER